MENGSKIKLSDQELLEQIASFSAAINRRKQINARKDLILEPGKDISDDFRRPSTIVNKARYNKQLVISRDQHGSGNTSSLFLYQSHNRKLELNKGKNSNCPDHSHVKKDNNWVKKKDRHRQLISNKIYKKWSEERAKLFETSRIRNKEKKRRLVDHKKVVQHLLQKRKEGNGTVKIDGDDFKVSRRGNKLVRIDSNTINKFSTRKLFINGVAYIMSSRGNLWRADFIKSSRNKSLQNLNKLCINFCMNGIRRCSLQPINNGIGKCAKGEKCCYLHDPRKRTACIKFLTNNCMSGNNCHLSHDLNEFNTPHCTHFIRNFCTNPNCLYLHVGVSKDAPVCPRYAGNGYCPLGSTCDKLHKHGPGSKSQTFNNSKRMTPKERNERKKDYTDSSSNESDQSSEFETDFDSGSSSEKSSFDDRDFIQI